METNRLKQFKILAETGNLRQAATLLHISHPGLSKSIRTLEEELNIKLITRDGRGIKITQEGQRFLVEIENFLSAESKLLSATKQVHHSLAEKAHIGTFEVFSTYLCPSLIRSLPTKIKFFLHEFIPGQLEEALLSRRIDYGITYLPIAKPELDFFKITEIKMGIFGIRELLSKIKKLEELPFVIPISTIDGAPTKVRGLDGWPDERIPRKIQYSVTLMESALAVVREGLGVAYLPKFISEFHNRVVKPEFQLCEYPSPRGLNSTQAVYAIKRKNTEEGLHFKAICKVLRGLK